VFVLFFLVKQCTYFPVFFYESFELDSIAQQLRHWNYFFLAARKEHAIPCGAKCYHTNLSRVLWVCGFYLGLCFALSLLLL
jgi:hypothetical protein